MIQQKSLFALVFTAALITAPVFAQNAALASAPTAPIAPSVQPAKPVAAVSQPNATRPVVQPGPNLEEMLASLKRELKITDLEAKNWDAFATSVINGFTTLQDTKKGAVAPLNALGIMEMHQHFAKARANSLDGIIAAFKPLYDQLTAGQKVNADRLLPQRLGMAI